MPDSADILTALRAHLAGAGIVRPANAVGAAPPFVLDPLEGPAAPGELEGIHNDPNLIITARPGGDLAPGPADGWLLQTTVDVIYRGKASDQIMAVDAQIVAEMFLPGGMAKTAWLMGGLQIIESRVWAGLQRLGSSKGQGFTYITKLYFETYR